MDDLPHDPLAALGLGLGWARRYGADARRMRKGAVTWTSMIAYHCSSVIFWMTLSQV